MAEKYQINPDVIWKEADGIIYILQPDREEIHALNETGTVIWKLVEKGRSPRDISNSLVEQYDVDARKAIKDVEEFIDQYVREKILLPAKKGRRK